MPSEPSVSAPPSSRYRIVSRIASGGMGSVYLATQHGAAGFRRAVAVKRAFPHLLEDPQFRRLMASEVRLASLVRHPNVVAISDVEETDGELSLVMEYVEGASLAELMKFDGGLPAALGLRAILDAAAGLQAVHDCTDEAGAALALVHRDVSPQNILVGVDGVARIADFGIAQAQSSAATGSGLLRGKPAYMAPEYVATACATPACDVFALAIVAWEVLTRQRLFRSSTDIETIDRVRATVVPPPSLFADEISPELDAVLLRALARDPNERYPSAQAFGEALEAAARTSATLASHGALGQFVRIGAGQTLSERRLLASLPTSTIGPPPASRSSGADIPVVIGATGATRLEPVPRSGWILSAFLALGLIGTVAVVASLARHAPKVAAHKAATTTLPEPAPVEPLVPAPTLPVLEVVPRPSARPVAIAPRPIVRVAVAIEASAAAPSLVVAPPRKAPENPYRP